MNRKANERENNDRDKDDLGVQPIMPKFAANWTQHIRLERLVVNVAGNLRPR
jgi:hypothetical protein